MSDNRFQNKYRIETARAWWHDYDGGFYFITICTKRREHFFGEIVDGEMVLSGIGEYTQQCIEEITQHNPYAEIPLYTIMPNHLHLIVLINVSAGRDVPWRVSTIFVSHPTTVALVAEAEGPSSIFLNQLN